MKTIYASSASTWSRRAPKSRAPASKRWRVLRTQALADGILEAGILAFYDKMLRPKELAWEPWRTGQLAKATQALDALEELVDNRVPASVRCPTFFGTGRKSG